jgi:hypothetical protein
MENKSEQGLKHTQRALMCVYAALMLFALIWVILGEFSQANFIGIWQGETGLLFVCQIIFQLGTLALIPLALRLFKFSKIHHSLVNDTTPNHAKLLLYGVLRMDMLLLPMIINLMLYYFFMVPGFGYMAIVLFLSSLFIVPTIEKCKAEITEKQA